MMKKQLYLLWGEEPYLIDKGLQQIIADAADTSGDQPEVVYFDCDEMEPLALREQLEFSPLFNLSRIAIIKRPFWMGKSKKKAGKAKDFEHVVNDYLDHAADGQTLVITADRVEKSSALYKRINKEGEIIQYKTPDNKYLVQWLSEEFNRRGTSCSPGGIRILAGSGQDMYYLANLVEKVSLQVGEKQVEEQDIEAELMTRHETSIFKLTDAVINRNIRGALSVFYKLLEQGEHPLVFLALINRQLIQLGKVKACNDRGYSRSQISAYTGLKDYPVKKLLEASRRFTSAEIAECYKLLMQTDLEIKSTSKDPEILIEALIIQICAN